MTTRGVLLDFYGTLVHEDDDVIPLICEEIRRTARIETTAREIGRHWWSGFAPLCNWSYGAAFRSQRDAATQTLGETIRHFRSSAEAGALIQRQFEHWQAPPIFADTVPFLHVLRENKLPVCVLSNIDRCDIEVAIALHGLAFDGVVTSDDARSYKPRPEMFRMGLETLGLGADEVLHIGDSRTNDVAGARALGIPVAWLNRKGRVVAAEPQADYVASDLVALAGLIQGQRL